MSASNPVPHGIEPAATERGPAPTRVIVGFGFWIFLLSDFVMFAAFFAAYAVLSTETAGGPAGSDLFDRGYVLIETFCLLVSSLTCGFMAIALERRRMPAVYLWAAATFALGLGFIGMEIAEFVHMVGEGAGPTRSAFLSSFFALVGTHGLHVIVGLLWLSTMVAQVATLGPRAMVVRRMQCFALFWHALDIVWVGVFTIVYLGAH